jgi:hypothetical protein
MPALVAVKPGSVILKASGSSKEVPGYPVCDQLSLEIIEMSTA